MNEVRCILLSERNHMCDFMSMAHERLHMCDFMSMAFWVRPNYGDSKSQWLIGSSQRIFGDGSSCFLILIRYTVLVRVL
jgi:hypothetical protein